MKQVPDRKRLRREYLRKKGKEYAVAGVFGTGMIPAAIGLMVCIIIPFLTYTLLVPQMTVCYLFVSVVSVLMALHFGRSIWLCWRGMQLSIQAAKALNHVPPVTPDTLPAEEILVRGSEEPPVAQSEVLLRAAQKGQETPKEELLRVSQE